MIFTVLFLYPCLLESIVKCASVDTGSHYTPPLSHLRSRRSSRSTSNVISFSDVSDNPLANHYHNGPPERARHLQKRQVSTSDWIFSSLAQPPSPTEEERQEQQPSSQSQPQNRRGNVGLSYRSLPSQSSPSNMYTNYYRNVNIYSQTPRRIDGGSDTKVQSRPRYNGYQPPSSSSADAEQSPSSVGPSFEALDRRRASSSLLPARNHVNGMSSTDAVLPTSKMPEDFNQRDTGTTGLSRTAPATDPSLSVSERPTSTQEMQISDDGSSSTTDEIELDSRGEFGRHRGRKRGREMSTTEPHSANSAPIIFPGSSTASTENVNRATTRPHIKAGDSSLSLAKINPFDARLIDGWKRLYDIRKKSQSQTETRKSSIASDQSADAKIISFLTIHGVPKCAGKDGYCEEIESYPRSFFNQILNKTLSPDIFKDIFGETTDNNSVVTDVEFKLRHDFEDTPLCSVKEHTIYPKAAQNRKGKFMYIVNHDEYLQGIRVETCQRENDACMFTDSHLPGYSSTCKQKFIYKKLLAFTPEGKAMPDTFRLPSCCVCYVRSMFISDRINPGLDIGNSDTQPTVASDDTSWGASSSTVGYVHRNSDDSHSSSPYPPTSSSTESAIDSVGSSITFPTTSKDDFPSFQVPSPTTSTFNPGAGQRF